MPAVASVLMCHAPIVVPDVVGARGEECARSTQAMRTAADRVVAARPEVLILVSPHTPRRRGFSLVAGARIVGDFGDFGAPEIVVDLPGASEARARILERTAGGELAVEEINVPRLDHGALVPLQFLVRAGWRGRTVVVSLPRTPTAERCRAFGRVLAAAAGDERWVVVASGDCSHRLIPGAPSGYHPQAHAFDAALHAAVGSGHTDALLAIDPELRDLAAEDAVDAILVAGGAALDQARGREVLSYEGPYGVGYLVAVLDDAGRADAAHALCNVATEALRAHIERRPPHALEVQRDDIADAEGVFVTWRRAGELRGCVGRMHIDGSVVDAVATLAIAAATDDPRFPPVELDELAELTPEVTLLERAVDIRGPEELDPHLFGVEVHCGGRRGVLLPHLEGIDTVQQQLAIVLRKAGIRADEPYMLRRFRAHKVV